MNVFLTNRNAISIITIFTIFTFFTVALAMIGGVLNYSPIPFHDMWNSFLFLSEIEQGNISTWWSLHCEHRLFLPRILYWIDMKWFGGLSWFLILTNYILVSLSAYVFWIILNDVTKSEEPHFTKKIIALFITAWLFQWIQQENLTWAFQSQFFLAQLLPLCSFYFLYKSTLNTHSYSNFLIACLLGISSAGTMASGVIALPLMTIYALLMKQSLSRIFTLILLTSFILFFYFLNYTIPSHHGKISQALLHNPIGFIEFILAFLGNPFYYLSGQEKHSYYIAILGGLIFITCSIHLTLTYIFQPKLFPLRIALLTYIVYIGGTAIATAGGRLVFGINQAFISRYTTPPLFGWSVLLLIYSPKIIKFLSKNNKQGELIRFIPLFILAGLLMIQQLKALQSPNEKIFQKNISALALTLHVEDDFQLRNIFPDPKGLRHVAKIAEEKNLSFFKIAPYKDLKAIIGSYKEKKNLVPCQGYLNTPFVVSGKDNFVSVSGWLFNPNIKTHSKLIHIQNDDGKIVGIALSGQPNPDVAKTIGKSALLSGFKGYILANEAGQSIIFQEENSSCQLKVTLPPILVSLIRDPTPELVTIQNGHILPHNQWIGLDFHKSVFNTLQVYGSHIYSDADIGSIALKIKKGDRVFYRSGPTGGNQIMEVIGYNLPPLILPVVTDWVLLDFSYISLPKSEFTLKFIDQGNNWGEWSAIAVKKDNSSIKES